MKLTFPTFLLLAYGVHGAQVDVERVPHGGIQPTGIYDASGTLHLLYFKGNPRGGDAYYVKRDGDTFSTPIKVNSVDRSVVAVGTMRGPQLAMGINGRLHVVWNASPEFLKAKMADPKKHDPTEHRYLFYSRLNDGGTAFETQRNLMSTTFALDGGASVAADGKGKVYVSWHATTAGAPAGEAGRTVYLRVSSDGGKTFSDERPARDQGLGACGCCGLTSIVDDTGKFHILFRAASKRVIRDAYLLTSADGGATFSSSRIDQWNLGMCPASSFALTSRSGRLYGAWEGQGSAFFKRLDIDSKKLQGPGEQHKRKHPRIALNAKGEALFVWAQGTGWQRGGHCGYQLFSADGAPVGQLGTVKNGVPVWSFATPIAKPDGNFVIFH